MRLAVVGGGGREHAIIKKLKESKKIEEIYALPGNGGIAEDAICVNIGAKEVDKIVDFAVENKIDYVVVAPDDPLVMGLVDMLEDKGIQCFGPDKAAAIIEGSKAFSKNLMKKYNIPTADYQVFTEINEALRYLESCKIPVVIKADGLALGKGVIIAESKEDAIDAVKMMMTEKKFGDSGNKVVIEEFLRGPEVSVLSFTDGNVIIPMVSSMDHKRALDGDKGLNTGGMGAIAPNPFYTKEIAESCMKEIFIPTIEAMKAEGRSFKGCLYFGLMITDDGVKVIEYNARFGDPETQVVLPLLRGDLLEIMLATSNGRLKDTELSFEDKHACCVVVASGGYPTKYKKGYKLTLPERKSNIFVAGTKLVDGKQLTCGGRVLGVTEIGDTLKEAIEKSYETVNKVNFTDLFYRTDIGKRGMK